MAKTNQQTNTIPDFSTIPRYIQNTNILPYPEVKKILDKATAETIKAFGKKP